MSAITDFMGGSGVSVIASNFTSRPDMMPLVCGVDFAIPVPEPSSNHWEPSPKGLEDAAAKGELAKYGTPATIAGNNTYEIVYDHTGECVLTTFFTSALAAIGDTLNVRFTVDGKETIIPFTAEFANDRFAMGKAQMYDTITKETVEYAWRIFHTSARQGNIMRFTAYSAPNTYPWIPVLLPPNTLFNEATCLYAAKSLKVEIQQSTAPPAGRDNAMALVLEF